jgi:hypothetical protein
VSAPRCTIRFASDTPEVVAEQSSAKRTSLPEFHYLPGLRIAKCIYGGMSSVPRKTRYRKAIERYPVSQSIHCDFILLTCRVPGYSGVAKRTPGCKSSHRGPVAKGRGIHEIGLLLFQTSFQSSR